MSESLVTSATTGALKIELSDAQLQQLAVYIAEHLLKRG